MTILTVGPGQQFTTIHEAVDAAAAGDTIDVQGGPAITYTNDFISIGKSLTLQAVGGEVQMVETQSPGNGKAMIVEGVSGANVAINGFDISGVSVPDSNGAAIRYEGGNLSLSNDYFHNNQEGLLGAPDPNGSISIDHSEFASNGDGSGSTHNIYVGAINSFTITNSYIRDAVVGHEIKSRAANNTITNNRIFDNNGSASYSVDLPNGGNANISGNVIEQGPNTQNPYIFAWGEEGASNGGSASVNGNTIVNDDAGGRGVLASSPVSFTNNQLWNLANLGNVAASGNVDLAARPSIDTSSLSFISPPAPTPTPTPTPTPAPVTTDTGADTLVLSMSEDAYLGDAQFTVAVDGEQLGGTFTATALLSDGASQDFIFKGDWAPGSHTVAVDFLNDAWAGTPSTDRNLYVTGATIDGQAIAGSTLNLWSNGPQSFGFSGSGSGATTPQAVTVGSGPDTLDLKVNEDAWGGDAQFTVSVDGQQIGGTLTAQASHAAGSVQDFLIEGLFGPGSHTATVDFINDAYGGTPSTDRNLYVTGATIDGQAIAGSTLNLWSNGPQSIAFPESLS